MKLDDLGFRKFGTHGLLWATASANLIEFAVVASVFAICGFGSVTRSLVLTREACNS
jgi:hypothetical protein